jgi:uncharacterized protein (TIGR00661 family)
MDGNNFNRLHSKPRILIAPLNWGLGHATRCIPIIKAFIYLNCEVIIAADKQTFSLLKKEFPTLVFLRCNDYEIEYSRNKIFFTLKLFLQFPRILFSIWKENKWLDKIIKEQKIDVVVSDNRFGMYSKKIFSIYITHQLNIKTGNRFTEIVSKKIHSYFIKKYFQCWVPDNKENGLAGDLSNSKSTGMNIIYIGPISRFHSNTRLEIIYDLLVTVSGPEPQRSVFENKILDQLKNFTGKALLVRGLPSENCNLLRSTHSLKIVNHLSAIELNNAFLQSKMIIGRCGYTTIMDLAALQKRAILVPTPGQAEQEYLAKYLFAKKYFFTVDQENFFLEEVLKKAALFEFRDIPVSFEKYKKTIEEFVLSLKSGNFAPQ